MKIMYIFNDHNEFFSLFYSMSLKTRIFYFSFFFFLNMCVCEMADARILGEQPTFVSMKILTLI